MPNKKGWGGGGGRDGHKIEEKEVMHILKMQSGSRPIAFGFG